MKCSFVYWDPNDSPSTAEINSALAEVFNGTAVPFCSEVESGSDDLVLGFFSEAVTPEQAQEAFYAFIKEDCDE